MMGALFSQMRLGFYFFSTKSCTLETVTLATDFEFRRDPFTVCLLVSDKDDEFMYKLVELNVVTGEEKTITEIPYRNNCAMLYVTGKLSDACFFSDIQLRQGNKINRTVTAFWVVEISLPVISLRDSFQNVKVQAFSHYSDPKGQPVNVPLCHINTTQS